LKVSKKLVVAVVILAVVGSLATAYAMGWFSLAKTVKVPPNGYIEATISGHLFAFMRAGSLVVIATADAVMPATLHEGDTKTITGWSIAGSQITDVWHVDFTWVSTDSSGSAVIKCVYGKGFSVYAPYALGVV